MTVFFSGKSFADNKVTALDEEVGKLKVMGLVPKLVSILIGDDPSGNLYLNLKKRAAEKIGMIVEIVNLDKDVKPAEVIKLINKLNRNDSVNGVMIQLPLPKTYTEGEKEQILESIEPGKDVDGLKKNSPYITPVAAAVVEVIKTSSKYLAKNHEAEVIVVGAGGFEGKKIFAILSEIGYSVKKADIKTNNLGKLTKNADIIISVTGKKDLIKSEMVKDGTVLIDVGSPNGDIEKNAYQKASFVSGVPGGVGPVTISHLLGNLIDATKKI